MKNLVLKIMALVLFIAGFSIVYGHVTWTTEFANTGVSYLSEDANEPTPESGFIVGQITCLSEEPNSVDPNNGGGDANTPE